MCPIYTAALALIFAFFAVTHPYGLEALGQMFFYGLWYAGLAVVVFGAMVLVLPYLHRAHWEGETRAAGMSRGVLCRSLINCEARVKSV